jgi:hypothetical protein
MFNDISSLKIAILAFLFNYGYFFVILDFLPFELFGDEMGLPLFHLRERAQSN